MGPLALTLSFLHSALVDETTTAYIVHVCFSPDGRLLAAGATDGVIRVSCGTFILAIVIIVIIFEVNAQRSTISGALDLGHHQEAITQQFPGSHPDDLLGRFFIGREIDCLWVGRWYGEDLGYYGRIVEDSYSDRRRWG